MFASCFCILFLVELFFLFTPTIGWAIIFYFVVLAPIDCWWNILFLLSLPQNSYFFLTSHKSVEVDLFSLPWFDILVELFLLLLFNFRIHFICFRSHSLIIWLSCFCCCFLTGANLFLCEMLTSVFDFVWFVYIFKIVNNYAIDTDSFSHLGIVLNLI